MNMNINILGHCDTRPMLYSIMKLLQHLGDTIIVTGNNRLLRLSDTGENLGHYQNIMIAHSTTDGIDEFWDSFPYNRGDFEFIVTDHIVDYNANVTIYCKGMVNTDEEDLIISQISDPIICQMYSKQFNYFDANTMYYMEEFESLQNMRCISPKLALDLSKVLAPKLQMSQKTLHNLMTSKPLEFKSNKKNFFGG